MSYRASPLHSLAYEVISETPITVAQHIPSLLLCLRGNFKSPIPLIRFTLGYILLLVFNPKTREMFTYQINIMHTIYTHRHYANIILGLVWTGVLKPCHIGGLPKIGNKVLMNSVWDSQGCQQYPHQIWKVVRPGSLTSMFTNSTNSPFPRRCIDQTPKIDRPF